MRQTVERLLRFIRKTGKLLILALPVGAAGGLTGVAFHHCIGAATALRGRWPWLLWCLPVLGILITALYRLLKLTPDRGTNRVLDGVRGDEPIPLRAAAAIFAATVLTQLGGGSAGREGAALQIGGGLGSFYGGCFRDKINADERRICILCGMSAVFSALFGTPLTAAVFSVEVIHPGHLPQKGLLPCLLSSLMAYAVAQMLGGERILLTLPALPALSVGLVLKVMLLALLAGVVAILFCRIMHLGHALFGKLGGNPYLHVIVGGLLIAGIGTLPEIAAYLGAGMNLVEAAVAGHADWYGFALKMALTALTLGAGFKGGEIVPCFAVGATFGCTAAPLIGLDPGLGAALGLVGVFCSVVNCPMAGILLGLELCGGQGVALFLIVSIVSLFFSGRCSLYTSQSLPKDTEEMNMAVE